MFPSAHLSFRSARGNEFRSGTTWNAITPVILHSIKHSMHTIEKTEIYEIYLIQIDIMCSYKRVLRFSSAIMQSFSTSCPPSCSSRLSQGSLSTEANSFHSLHDFYFLKSTGGGGVCLNSIFFSWAIRRKSLISVLLRPNLQNQLRTGRYCCPMLL